MKRAFLKVLWARFEAALTAAAFAEERDVATARDILANARSLHPAMTR